MEGECKKKIREILDLICVFLYKMINKLFLLLYIFFNVESIVTRGGQKTEIRPKPVLPLSKTDKRAGLYGSSGPRVNIFSFM